MKLKFNHLDYQQKAAMSVVNLFKGQSNKSNKKLIDRILKGEGTLYEEWEDISIFSNNILEITNEEILRNLQEVQKVNGLRVDKELKTLDAACTPVIGEKIRKTHFFTWTRKSSRLIKLLLSKSELKRLKTKSGVKCFKEPWGLRLL